MRNQQEGRLIVQKSYKQTLMAQLGMTDSRSFEAYQAAYKKLKAHGWTIKRYGRAFEIYKGDIEYRSNVWGLIALVERQAQS